MNIQFTANYLTSAEASGDIFSLKATHPAHVRNREAQPPEGQKSFGQLFFDAINEVNNDQQIAHNISIQAASNPDSVEPHDVTIAMAKANLSLSISKNIVDRVVQAYREITTLR